MPMRIARPMIGTEGLQSGPVAVRSGVGASIFSFKESLGENLAAPPGPDEIQPATMSSHSFLKLETAGEKTKEQVQVPAKAESLAAIQRSIAPASPSEASVSGIDATIATDSDLDVSTVPQVQDGGAKQVFTVEEISPKPNEQPSVAVEMSEPTTCKTEEDPLSGEHPIDRIPPAEEADLPKEVKEAVKVSSTAGAKGKEIETLPRQKEKRGVKDVTIEGQAVQQNLHLENLMAVPSSVPAEMQTTNIAASKKSQSPAEEVKVAAGSDGKPLPVHVLRQSQANQVIAKSSHSSPATPETTERKQVEQTPPEGEPSIDATTTKADGAGQSHTSKDEPRATTPGTLHQEAALPVSVPQSHAPAVEPAGRIASVPLAHPVHSQQIDSAVSHAPYAPGDHGTLTATPRSLEVGVPGGTHGWLKVRAELGSDGSVHASMSSNSAAETETLRRELPQLTSYLHQEQVRVSSVVVHAPPASAGLPNQAGGDGRGQLMNGGSPDAHKGDTGAGSHQSSHSQASARQTFLGSDDDGDFLRPARFGSAGGWLSVRA